MPYPHRRVLSVVVVAGVLMPLAWALHAQTKRPMALDDLLTAVRVGDPQVSPDGRRVLYTRTTTSLVTGKRNPDLWVVPSDGSAAPQLFIGGPASETSPRFHPDGARVLFISTGHGEPQVYISARDGTDIKPVTKLSGGVQPPLIVSPDGKLVAFVADAFPSCTDDACNARMRETLDKDPVKVHTLMRLPFRHWNEWWEQVRHHVFVADIATGQTRDLTPGDFDAPPHNYEDGAIAFSPDSKEIAFVSKRDAPDSEMWTTNHDVWVVPVTGGTPRRVTANPAADMQPVYSPDGKTLVVRAQRRPGFEADRWYLDAYDRVSGAKRTLFETPDLSVDNFGFGRSGGSIWFTAVEKGTANLYQLPAAGGSPRLFTKGGVIGEVSAGTDIAVFTKSSLVSPADLFRVGADGTVTQLTHENASWLDAVTMPAPESASVPGANGAAIQYWTLKPPGFDATRKYPVVFLIHGGPQGAWEDAWSARWNPALWASQGWVVVAPNPRGSVGTGQTFVDEISQDWCGKVMTDLNAVFDTVARLPYVDANRQAIAGASYGGYAVDWIIGHDRRFKAAVSHDGVFNLESMSFTTEELWFSEWEFGGPPWSDIARRNFARCSPHLSADKIVTPTLVITNELDYRVPVDQGLQLYTSLKRRGVPAEALVFPDEGHWVLKPLNSKRWHETVFSWLKKYL